MNKNFFKDLFIRESKFEQGKGQRRERTSSRLTAERGALCGALSQGPEIVTRAEIKRWTLNPLNHPGTTMNKIDLLSHKDSVIHMLGIGWTVR